MVVSDDAQANASIHIQISTGVGLVKSLALYVLQLLCRFPSLTKQVLCLSMHMSTSLLHGMSCCIE